MPVSEKEQQQINSLVARFEAVTGYRQSHEIANRDINTKTRADVGGLVLGGSSGSSSSSWSSGGSSSGDGYLGGSGSSGGGSSFGSW